MEEANRSIGWNLECRQLSKGSFHGQFNTLEHDGIALTSESFNTSLHIQAEPPAGILGIVIPVTENSSIRAGSHLMEDGELVLFPSHSSMDFVSGEGSTDHAIYLRQVEFLRMTEALFPAQELVTPGQSALHRCNPAQVRKVIRNIEAIHRESLSEPEQLSNLIVSLIGLVADAEGLQDENLTSNARASFVALRAQEFIEDNFRDPISMDSLCRETKTSVRTLQRCFVNHFQITPISYITARRMHEARRSLAEANPDWSSVTEIALDCGFSHLGRFSVNYRAHFRESPRDTLAKR